MPRTRRSARLLATLCIDIGGSHVKAAVVDDNGRMVSERVQLPTPNPALPSHLMHAIASLAASLRKYERISVGFPGVVRDGRVLTAPNLGTRAWHGFDLSGQLSALLGRPSRVLNDAEVQGLDVIAGNGLECVLTLGTGVGSALFRDGMLMPHLELGQHPVWKKRTYDQYLGHAALIAKGQRKWNQRLEKALGFVATLTNYDILYLGGGNAAKVTLALPDRIKLVSNEHGITGGALLWSPRFDAIFAPRDHRGRRSADDSKERDGAT